MKKKEKIRSVVVVVIAVAVAVVSSIPASAVAEEVRSDAVERVVVALDDEAVIEFIPIRAVLSWDPDEIEIESVPSPRAVVSWDLAEVEIVSVPASQCPAQEVQVARFDPDPPVPPTAPHAVVVVPPLPERVRRSPARYSIHPVRVAQR